jgi:hypothetical protein
VLQEHDLVLRSSDNDQKLAPSDRCASWLSRGGSIGVGGSIGTIAKPSLTARRENDVAQTGVEITGLGG